MWGTKMGLKAEINCFRFKNPRLGTSYFENLSLEVNSGEIVGLVARSGVGKSTLARLLAGHKMPGDCLNGTILCDGCEVRQPDSPVALVFQDYKRAVFPWLTVESNINLGIRQTQQQNNKGISKKILESLGISVYMDEYPTYMSGGELQRVQIARAVVSEVKYLILDEVTTSLDAVLRDEVHLQIKNIVTLKNVGVLLITHNIDDAILLCSRIYVAKKNSTGKVTIALVQGLNNLNREDNVILDSRFVEIRKTVWEELIT